MNSGSALAQEFEIDFDYYESQDKINSVPKKLNAHQRKRRLDHSDYTYSYDGAGYGYDYTGYDYYDTNIDYSYDTYYYEPMD